MSTATSSNTDPLISTEALAQRLGDENLLVIDCRFDIADAAKGARDYESAHIPGAVYANLDRDLSDLSIEGVGRHPLPSDAAFSAALSRWGWHSGLDVVAYDNANGALAAARLWWMLRLIGHHRTTVLDGGLAAWSAADAPMQMGASMRYATRARAAIDRAQIVGYDELQRRLADGSALLIDARAAPRYRGEVEPIDSKAGHVPRALNRPFSENLATDGKFKPREQLRLEFEALLGTHTPHDVVHM
ncbi:MAG: sulfurtransferase, partial [Rhodanobacteraceae bacterium]